MTVRPRSDKLFHKSPILCFALHAERPLAISGDEEGNVFACQVMTGEIVGCIGTHKDSVESIVINSSSAIAASAGIDSKINVYDLKDQNCSIKFVVEPTVYGGFTKLLLSSCLPNVIYAASTLGDLFLIDQRNGVVIKAFKGHAAPINALIEMPENKTVVTAGDDNQCMAFDLKSV
jgi:WD40 repeat protein